MMGEAGWLFGNPIDYFKVWITPTSYNPTAGTGISTSASRMLVSDDFHSQENFTIFSATRNLNAFAGQTVRLIFEWINNGNSGSQPPTAIDNISLSVNSWVINPTNTNTYDKIVNMSITSSLGETYSNATPSGNSGYLYTNNQPAIDLVRGSSTNTLFMTFGTNDPVNVQYSGAWIDFNGNGVFEASETIAMAVDPATSNASVTYTFAIPAGASLGQKRIRLRGGSDTAYTNAGACNTTIYGDTEDYNVNIVDASISTNYTWNGNVNASWQIASNWTPNGIPSSFDNITITASTSNTLNITDRRTINNFTLNGPFNMAAASNLIIRGNVAYNGSATANLNCASKIEIRSATTQTIPPLTYGNLDATGGNRTLPSTGTVGICNVFTPGSATYTVTGSTVNYVSPATGTTFTLPSFTYNNLTFSGTATYTIGQGNTINVRGNYNQSAGFVNLTNFTSGTNTMNVDGDMSITGGTLNMNANTTAGATSIINLKGDLTISAAGKLDATQGNNTGKDFNFNGTGNGTTATQIQSVNVAFPDAARNRRIQFYAKPGSYVQLARDFDLGDRSRFFVDGGAILDLLELLPTISQETEEWRQISQLLQVHISKSHHRKV